MRFILSLLIIVVISTYLLIPVVPTIRNLFKGFTNRVENIFNKNKNEEDDF